MKCDHCGAWSGEHRSWCKRPTIVTRSIGRHDNALRAQSASGRRGCCGTWPPAPHSTVCLKRYEPESSELVAKVRARTEGPLALKCTPAVLFRAEKLVVNEEVMRRDDRVSRDARHLAGRVAPEDALPSIESSHPSHAQATRTRGYPFALALTFEASGTQIVTSMPQLPFLAEEFVAWEEGADDATSVSAVYFGNKVVLPATCAFGSAIPTRALRDGVRVSTDVLHPGVCIAVQVSCEGRVPPTRERPVKWHGVFYGEVGPDALQQAAEAQRAARTAVDESGKALFRRFIVPSASTSYTVDTDNWDELLCTPMGVG